jgi:hypothetical protein
MICPYCDKEAPWVENKAIYGKNYGKSYMCYYCKECQAWVGCHNNTKNPLGTMANYETREWRKQAHDAFDPMWKLGRVSRDEAYRRLNTAFGREIHIGESDIETCKRIVMIATTLLTKGVYICAQDPV